MPQWYNVGHVALLYEADVNQVPVTKISIYRSSDPMLIAMQARGFLYITRRLTSNPEQGAYALRKERLDKDLPTLLKFMRDETPMALTLQTARDLPALPTPDVSTVTYTLDTPFGETYNLVSQYFFKQEAFQSRHTDGKCSNPTKEKLPHACIEAQLECYRDSGVQQSLTTLFWIGLRALDASTKPWKPG